MISKIVKKDTTMFHGQRRTKFGIKPRYKAKNPSVRNVLEGNERKRIIRIYRYHTIVTENYTTVVEMLTVKMQSREFL